MGYFNNHCHTHYSNIRLLDCINRPKQLIDKAIEMGLTGIAITDHECLSGAMEINQYAKQLQDTHPDFTVALGNEIYLTDTREKGQKYYHFILIAKDAIGHKALRELSSIAWINSYFDRGLERVPLLKEELETIIQRYTGHVIATTACIGGELGTAIINLENAKKVNDTEQIDYFYNQIVDFITFCKRIFNDDFYLECAPASTKEQIIVNKKLQDLSNVFDLNICVGTDSHYLTKDDRFVHKAYLNSKGGEREVDSFYEFARLMTEEEVKELLSLSYEEDIIDKIIKCSNEIKNKIEFYSLEHKQHVPEVEVKDYSPQTFIPAEWYELYPTLCKLIRSDNIQERYWINECIIALQEKGLYDNKKYLERLEEEAKVKALIGEKLETCMFAYPNTLKHYIDLFWECGSTIGAGRGSACGALNHYLLGITQLDPLVWGLPFWRYLNETRYELGDIDIDLAPSKLQKIFEKIREERGELGLVQVCTFGTEGTKSTILTACRGYRSEEYPDGINNDIAQYISSLVPQERGFLYSLSDLIYGNQEKDRKPNKTFIATVDQYPGLLNIMLGIENLVNKRSSHASGVILFDENIYDNAAVMKTPSGALITQWDLKDQEAAGSVKYDFLLTSVQDIIIQTIQLLQKDNIIESNLSLREVYNKYLHPSVLPIDDEKIWTALANNDVINCFQFDSAVGAQAAKKIKPTNPMEMARANGLMRLMASEKGGETPLDKYVRQKNDISLWYEEMEEAGLTEEEVSVLEPYFKPAYGIPPDQESMMQILMDENICGFTLAEANAARKICGKKIMSKIPALREQVLNKAKSTALGHYVWTYGIGPQMSYSFSIIHAVAYSFIGIQTLYLATHFNPIYWNTACLIVNSGSTNLATDEQTDYSKTAKAIGEIQKHGIKVSLVDINNSDFGFIPDAKNNQILFGLKGLINVGNDLINEIIENRPYDSLYDFYTRIKPKRQSMISLVKGGAFDSFMPRKKAMVEYLWLACDKKKRITLQNMPGLIKYDLLPQTTEDQIFALKVYEFNRYLKAECKQGASFVLDERALQFLHSNNLAENLIENGTLDAKSWDKIYQGWMDIFRNWISGNKEKILSDLNTCIFMEDWNKYATGNISSWEMEVLCFYYHEHELKDVNMPKYGLMNFLSLPEEPVVDTIYKRKGSAYPIYKLSKICGTCIAKDKVKNTVYLLTTECVVPVKFRQEYFSMFDKQISEKRADGTKKIVEKSFFNRGGKIIVQGIRRGDSFIAKNYSNSSSHQLYKIVDVDEQGDIILQHERYKGVTDEEN